MISKTTHWISTHRTLSIIILICIAGGGYYIYSSFSKTPTAAQYTTGKVERGTIITSVSGSGQVSSLNQIDVKPEVSGKLISVKKSAGQYAYAGEILGQIDTSDIEKSIRDAAMNLESANLSLAMQKESSSNIDKLIADGYNEVADTFLDLPSIITGIHDSLFDQSIASYTNLVEWQGADLVRPLITSAEKSYYSARTAYDNAFAEYHLINRSDGQEKISKFIDTTSQTAVLVADAIKNEINLIDFIFDYNSKNKSMLSSAQTTLLNKYRSNLTSYTSQINPHISSLASIQSSIINSPLNIASSELSIKQKENALADIRESLPNYTIRAPISGVVATSDMRVGDNVSPSTMFMSMISSSQYASISLNEIDVSKIKVGQKSTLTLDAIEGLTVTGKVISIDVLGTLSQGVVNYNVKIGFDTKDARIKPGMSVSASIITNAKQDVLMVPNAAIKSQNGEYYVETVSTNATNTTPNKIAVTIGDANDTSTEIINGLAEGDEIIVKTISPATKTTTATQGSGIRIPGLGGGR